MENWKKELLKDPIWVKYYEATEKYYEWLDLMKELKRFENGK